MSSQRDPRGGVIWPRTLAVGAEQSARGRGRGASGSPGVSADGLAYTKVAGLGTLSRARATSSFAGCRTVAIFVSAGVIVGLLGIWPERHGDNPFEVGKIERLVDIGECAEF